MCEKNFDGKTQLTPLRGQRYNIDVNLFRGEVKVLTGSYSLRKVLALPIR